MYISSLDEIFIFQYFILAVLKIRSRISDLLMQNK